MKKFALTCTYTSVIFTLIASHLVEKSSLPFFDGIIAGFLAVWLSYWVVEKVVVSNYQAQSNIILLALVTLIGHLGTEWMYGIGYQAAFWVSFLFLAYEIGQLIFIRGEAVHTYLVNTKKKVQAKKESLKSSFNQHAEPWIPVLLPVWNLGKALLSGKQNPETSTETSSQQEKTVKEDYIKLDLSEEDFDVEAQWVYGNDVSLPAEKKAEASEDSKKEPHLQAVPDQKEATQQTAKKAVA